MLESYSQSLPLIIVCFGAVVMCEALECYHGSDLSTHLLLIKLFFFIARFSCVQRYHEYFVSSRLCDLLSNWVLVQKKSLPQFPAGD